MRTVLFIDPNLDDEPCLAGRRTRSLVCDLRSGGFGVVMLTRDGTTTGTLPGGVRVYPVGAAGDVSTPDAEARWRRSALASADMAAEGGAAAVVSAISGAVAANVAAAVAARWSVPWVAEIRSPSALVPVRPGDFADWSREGLRSVVASAHALVLRTPGDVAVIRALFPELGLKHVVCVPDRPFDPAGELPAPSPLSRLLDEILPSRAAAEIERPHLRVVPQVG